VGKCLKLGETGTAVKVLADHATYGFELGATGDEEGKGVPLAKLYSSILEQQSLRRAIVLRELEKGQPRKGEEEAVGGIVLALLALRAGAKEGQASEAMEELKALGDDKVRQGFAYLSKRKAILGDIPQSESWFKSLAEGS